MSDTNGATLAEPFRLNDNCFQDRPPRAVTWRAAEEILEFQPGRMVADGEWWSFSAGSPAA